MFPTELEIAEQRRQFEREAANYRLSKELRSSTGAPSIAHRLSLWIGSRRPQRRPDCSAESVTITALQS